MTKEEKLVILVAMQLFRLRWARHFGSVTSQLNTLAGRNLMDDLDRACAALQSKRRRKQ